MIMKGWLYYASEFPEEMKGTFRCERCQKVFKRESDYKVTTCLYLSIYVSIS